MNRTRNAHFVLPLAGVLVFVLFALLFAFEPRIYAALLEFWGIAPFRFPFLDAHAVVAAIECKRLGYDVYVANPCDVLTRAHVYSPLFLEASAFPISVDHTRAFGIILALAFFAAFASLPPPRDKFGWCITALALFSTMVIFAIERGNNDLMIFVIAVAEGHLVTRSWRARWLAYALILVAGLLKYYPLTLMIVALREKPRAFLTIAAATILAVGIFFAHYRAELAIGMTLVPTGSYYTDLFGAVNLPFGMMGLLTPLTDQFPLAATVFALLPWLILVLLLATGLRAAASVMARAELHDALRRPEGIFLVIGSIAIVSCFFAGQSIGYRGVFFLLLLPGLLAMARGADARQFRNAAVMIVFLMWGEFFREALQRTKFDDPQMTFALQAVKTVYWLFRELIWWRVIGVLIGIVLGFAVESEIGRRVLNHVPILKRATP